MKKTYLDGKMALSLPEGWTITDRSVIEAQFGTNTRPFLSIQQEQTSGTCMLFYTDERLDAENFDTVFAQQYAYFVRMTPGYAEFATPRREKDGHMYRCIIYKQNAPDGGELFTVFFMTHVEDRMLFGMFSCPFSQREKLNLVAMNMIESISMAD